MSTEQDSNKPGLSGVNYTALQAKVGATLETRMDGSALEAGTTVESGPDDEENQYLTDAASSRDLSNVNLFVWKCRAGIVTHAVYSELGLLGGIDLAVNLQAAIPVRATDGEEYSPWEKYVAQVASRQLVKNIVDVLISRKVFRDSPATTMEAVSEAVKMQLMIVFPSASVIMILHLQTVCLSFFSHLGLVVEPGRSIAYGETFLEDELSSWPSFELAITRGVVLSNVLDPIHGLLQKSPSVFEPVAIQGALYEFIDGMTRSRSMYMQYMHAVRAMLGVLRFSIVTGKEPTYASSSKAFVRLRSNACAILAAARDESLPAPSIMPTAKWLVDSELAFAALNCITRPEGEVEEIDFRAYQDTFHCLRTEKSLAFLAVGHAAAEEKGHRFILHYKSGTEEVNRIKPDNQMAPGEEEMHSALRPLSVPSHVKSVMLAAANVKRLGSQEICSIGLKQQFLLAMGLANGTEFFYEVPGGLDSCRARQGLSQATIATYMARNVIIGFFAPARRLGYAPLDPRVSAIDSGAAGGTNSMMTFSPWAVVRACLPAALGVRTQPERHVGLLLKETPRGEVKGLAKHSYALFEIKPKADLNYQITVNKDDELVMFSPRAVRVEKFFLDTAIYPQDEHIKYVTGYSNRREEQFLLMVLGAALWSAISVGKAKKVFEGETSALFVNSLVSPGLDRSAGLLQSKLQSYALRSLDTRAGMQQAAIGSRVAVVDSYFKMVGFEASRSVFMSALRSVEFMGSRSLTEAMEKRDGNV